MSRPGRGRPGRKPRPSGRARAQTQRHAPFASTLAHASTRWTRWIAYGVLALFAVYWGARVFSDHRIGNYGVETDFYWKYGPAAQDLLQGRVQIENYDSKGWGYPAAVAIIAWTGLEPFRAAQVLALISAVLVGWLVYRLHRSLLGPGAALGSLLLLLANDTFLANTYEVGTDMFFFAVVLGSIALLLRSGAPGPLAILGSGLLGGWAFSTRYNGLFLWPGALAILLLLRLPEGPPLARLRRAGLWSGGFLAAALPWLIVNAVHTGNPLTNSNYINVGYTVYGEGNWEKFFYGSERAIRSLPDVVLLDPARFASAMAKSLVNHLRKDLSELVPIVWGVLAVLGGVLLLRDRPGRRLAGYAILWGLYFLTLVPVFYGARFALPLLAWYLLLATWVFVSPTTGRPIQSLERSFPLRTFLFLGLWIYSAVHAYHWADDPLNKERVRAGPYELLPAIDYLKAHGAGEALLARKPHAAYIARMRFVPIPEIDSPAALHAVAEKERARYLLVSAMERRMRAAIRVFGTGVPIAGFTRVFESSDALVYRVDPIAAAPAPGAQPP